MPILRLPVKHIDINQPFGANYLSWYRQWGLRGHNGIDFTSRIGCSVYACHPGKVTVCGFDNDGGREIRIWNEKERYLTIYYHLDEFLCKEGDIIEVGQMIAKSGNSGRWTTGPHLHLGMKFTDGEGNTINQGNGYLGCVNPGLYFKYTFDRQEFNNKDWDKPNVYHRYWRKDKRNLLIEIKKQFELTKFLKRLAKPNEINAVVYGAWDRDAIVNPAMYELWSQITKGDYLKGIRPFT